MLNKNNIEDLMLLEKKCFNESLKESREAFLNIAEIFPKGAVLLYSDNRIIGTLFFHPCIKDSTRKLKNDKFTLEGNEDCMYLHSFSIHPDFTGKGLAHILFDYFNSVTSEEKITQQSLVAVQNSENFWMRYGFKPRKQIQYGNSQATYMTRNI